MQKWFLLFFFIILCFQARAGLIAETVNHITVGFTGNETKIEEQYTNGTVGGYDNITNITEVPENKTVTIKIPEEVDEVIEEEPKEEAPITIEEEIPPTEKKGIWYYLLPLIENIVCLGLFFYCRKMKNENKEQQGNSDKTQVP